MTIDRSPPTDRPDRDEAPQEPRTIRSAELLAGQKTVVIEHDGTKYRLLVTRNNRLILHK